VLLDPGHEVPGSFAERSNFIDLLVKEDLLGVLNDQLKLFVVPQVMEFPITLDCFRALLRPPALRVTFFFFF
jgi:hypothetical protein